MVMLNIMQKTVSTSIEVMVMVLGIKKRKESGVVCSYEHDSKECTLQEEGNSPSQLRAWSIKNSGIYCCFGKREPKRVFERYRSFV